LVLTESVDAMSLGHDLGRLISNGFSHCDFVQLKSAGLGFSITLCRISLYCSQRVADNTISRSEE
jgi:hypothetical protein